MTVGHGGAAQRLSFRERECLCLLAGGLSQRDVAAALVISPSTVDKHLAAARRKLDARTTAQAVVIHSGGSGERRPAGSSMETCTAVGGLASRHIDLLDRVNAAAGLEGAWAAFHEHLAEFGVSAINFGFIGDPAGRVSDDACYMKSSMPKEILHLYFAMGGYRADPVTHHATRSTTPWALSIREVLEPQFRDWLVPPPVRDLAEGLVETKLRQALHIPGRDPGTGAPVITTLFFPGVERNEFARLLASHGASLRKAARLFWLAVQERRLLSGVPGLSGREKEALLLAAAGLRTADVGGRMGVSRRGAEKLLSGARRKLKAATNAEAVYRGLVYRAIGGGPVATDGAALAWWALS